MRVTAGKVYLEAVRKYWLSYVLGILAMVVTNFSEVIIPKVIQWSLDIITGGDEDRVAQLKEMALLLFWSLVAGFWGRVGWRQFLGRRTHVAGWDLKVRLWDVLRHQPLRILHRYSLGDIMNRATGDWSASRNIFGFSLVLALDIVCIAVFAVVAMLTIDVTLTLYCLIVFPLLPYFIGVLARKELLLHGVAQESLGVLSDNVAQSLGAIRLQRATATGHLMRTRLESEARDYAAKRFAVVKTGWKIFPLGALPTLCAYGVLMVIGLGKLRSGTLSLGEFVALQSYVLMLQTPLFELGECIAEWQKGWASLGRIAEILSLKKPKPADSRHHVVQQSAKGDEMTDPSMINPRLERHLTKNAGNEDDSSEILRIDHLDYSYVSSAGDVDSLARRPLVLKDVCLSVSRGARIGIYGPIGAGKSTLLSLIAGLTECKPGMIFLEGVDVAHLPRSWYASHVTVVPQRAFLFAGPIRKNLVLDGNFSESELWDVLNVVGMRESVRAMPHGLDTWIGEWGITLSGGQRQRLALARALLRPRSLLLLDDCLSAVDTVTEDLVLHHLSRRLGKTAIIWVAHRPSTLKLCDQLYQLEAGVLTRSTSPKDLLEHSIHTEGATPT